MGTFAMNAIDHDHARHDQSIPALFIELRHSLANSTVLKQPISISYS